MFSLLEKKEETKNTINVLGSNVTYDESSDLKQVLKKHGYRVCSIADYQTFEGFMEMASAKLNIVAVTPLHWLLPG